MKFKIFEEVIVFPEVKKDRVISCIRELFSESYELEKNGWTPNTRIVSQEDLREDMKSVSETLFSLSLPMRESLIDLGLIKFLLKADAALCEELGVEKWQRQ